MKFSVSVTSHPFYNERYSNVDSWVVGDREALYGEDCHSAMFGVVMDVLYGRLSNKAHKNKPTYTVEILEP